MRWRVYYGDGVCFDASQGTAADAPALDVQMIAVADPDHGWHLCRSADYYWYLPERDTWSCGDIFGLWDYLSRPGMKRVLFGRTTDIATFQAILKRAMNDMPQKTGWQPNERKLCQ